MIVEELPIKMGEIAAGFAGSKATVSNISGQCGAATITVKNSCSNQGTKDVRMPSGVWYTVYEERSYPAGVYECCQTICQQADGSPGWTRMEQWTFDNPLPYCTVYNTAINRTKLLWYKLWREQ